MRLVNVNCTADSIRGLALPTCSIPWGAWKGALLVQKGWSLTASQVAAFKTSIAAALVDKDYNDRIFMVGSFHTCTPAYKEKNVKENPDGSTEVTRNSVAGWDAILSNGGQCYSRAMGSLDGLHDHFDIVFIAAGQGIKGFNFVGSSTFNTTSLEWEFCGAQLSMLNADTPMVGDPSETDRYPFSFQLADKDQIFKQGMVINVNFDPFKDLPGITDVTITQMSTVSGAGTVTLGLAIGCGAINPLTGSLASTWANVARFKATNKSTGATITISSATISNGLLLFDMDVTDLDYPTAGNLIAIELVDVDTLAAAGLKYFVSYAENPVQGINGTQLFVTAT